MFSIYVDVIIPRVVSCFQYWTINEIGLSIIKLIDYNNVIKKKYLINFIKYNLTITNVWKYFTLNLIF